MTNTGPVHAGGVSAPRVRTEWSVDSAKIAVTYGRLSLKGRTVDAIISQGVVWKPGDGEPTMLASDKALIFGDRTVPAGTYSLWIRPQSKAWELVLSKAGESVAEYQPTQDVVRIAMKVDKLNQSVEPATVAIEPTTGGGVLSIEIGAVKASAAFAVKR